MLDKPSIQFHEGKHTPILQMHSPSLISEAMRQLSFSSFQTCRQPMGDLTDSFMCYLRTVDLENSLQCLSSHFAGLISPRSKRWLRARVASANATADQNNRPGIPPVGGRRRHIYSICSVLSKLCIHFNRCIDAVDRSQTLFCVFDA